MAKLIDLKAREILDSRGVPTIEVDAQLEGRSRPGRRALRRLAGEA